MSGLGRYESVTIQNDASSRDRRDRLKKQFKNSPIGNESYDREHLNEIVNQLMLKHFNYDGAPSWSDVHETISWYKGRHGYPTTPWTPNQVSPGEGNGIDPDKVREYEVSPTDIKEGFVIDTNGTINPQKASKEISSARLGDGLIKGKHPTPK